MAEGIPDGNLIDPVPSSVVQPHESLSIVLASTTSIEAEFNLENVKRYFDHKGVNLENTTLLHAAAGFGALQSVKYLIEQGVDVNITDETTGCIPLHNAVCHNHYEVAVYLIKHGASVDQGDKKGNTPTHSAAENINWNFYRLLLENGGDINKENADGVTPEALFQNQRQSAVAGSLSFTSENSSYSLNQYKVQNTDDDQRPSGTDLEQKMDAVKTEFRKIPDKKKKMFVVNLTKILQTCSIEQPDQNSGQTDEETLSAGQAVGGCNQLDQSLLPDFDKIDSENSKNSNFRSGIRNTICNYLKKDSNG